MRPDATCGGQAKGVCTTGDSVVDTDTQSASGVLGLKGIGNARDNTTHGCPWVFFLDRSYLVLENYIRWKRSGFNFVQRLFNNHPIVESPNVEIFAETIVVITCQCIPVNRQNYSVDSWEYHISRYIAHVYIIANS